MIQIKIDRILVKRGNTCLDKSFHSFHFVIDLKIETISELRRTVVVRIKDILNI
jgi:hypothetical protein